MLVEAVIRRIEVSPFDSSQLLVDLDGRYVKFGNGIPAKYPARTEVMLESRGWVSLRSRKPGDHIWVPALEVYNTSEPNAPEMKIFEDEERARIFEIIDERLRDHGVIT
jgi:hypothetical protein